MLARRDADLAAAECEAARLGAAAAEAADALAARDSQLAEAEKQLADLRCARIAIAIHPVLPYPGPQLTQAMALGLQPDIQSRTSLKSHCGKSALAVWKSVLGGQHSQPYPGPTHTGEGPGLRP